MVDVWEEAGRGERAWGRGGIIYIEWSSRLNTADLILWMCETIHVVG